MFNTNEYYNGHVKSIAFRSGHGKATVGVMAPGEYEFKTSSPEHMSVVMGEMHVKINGEPDFVTYKAGEKFYVGPNSSFKVKVDVETSYLCIYE